MSDINVYKELGQKLVLVCVNKLARFTNYVLQCRGLVKIFRVSRVEKEEDYRLKNRLNNFVHHLIENWVL